MEVKTLTLFVTIVITWNSLRAVCQIDEKLTFVVSGQLPIQLESHVAVYDGRETIYILGGYSVTDTQPEVFKYSLESGQVTDDGTFVGIQSGSAFMHGTEIVHLGGRYPPLGSLPRVYWYSKIGSKTVAHMNISQTSFESAAMAWDPDNEVAYIFGGMHRPQSGGGQTYDLDQILQFNVTSNKIEQIGYLPEPRVGAGAVWHPQNGVVYIFGGHNSTNSSLSSDIMVFDPIKRTVTKLEAPLPDPVMNAGTPVFTENNQQMYMLGPRGLIKFDPDNLKSEKMVVDGLPDDIRFATSVFVSDQNRVYIIGGIGRNEIGYINLGPHSEDPTEPTAEAPTDPTHQCFPSLVVIAGTAVASVAFLLLLSGIVILFRLSRARRESASVQHLVDLVTPSRRVIDQVEVDRFRQGFQPNSKHKHVSRDDIILEWKTWRGSVGEDRWSGDSYIWLSEIDSNPFDERFEIARHKFTIDKGSRIGAGEFGKVYLGKVRVKDGDAVEKVAIKVPQRNCPEAVFTGLLKELKIMTHLRHENVVSLVGANTSRVVYGRLFIIMEFCEEGSIEQFFQRRKWCFVNKEKKCWAEEKIVRQNSHYVDIFLPLSFSIVELLRWSKEIATGMEFLASKGVVHRDLAARNILLTTSLNAKISDFGLSRQLYGNSSYVQQSPNRKLPCRWMAVECFSGEFSTFSDIWSYGILVWEIFALGSLPYKKITVQDEKDVQPFAELLRNGLRITEMRHATPQIFDKLKECWHMEPSKRPTFADLRVFFENISV